MSQLPALVNENNIPVSLEAKNIICSYPLGKVRACIPIREYIAYKNDWYFFDNVWSYNYTVSTIRSTENLYVRPYHFLNNAEMVSYSNGQSAHVAYYSNVSSSVFRNIF